MEEISITSIFKKISQHFRQKKINKLEQRIAGLEKKISTRELIINARNKANMCQLEELEDWVQKLAELETELNQLKS